MNVVVCGKVIPASTVIIEIDANSKRMVRKGVPHELDPMAASAVEEGLRLVEKHGGALTLITMGTSDATIGIRNALAMGATDFGASTDPKELRKHFGRFDLILSTVHAKLDWTTYLQTLRPNGTLCLLGMPPGVIQVPPALLVTGHRSITGSDIASRRTIREMLRFAARHRIAPLLERMPMAEANAALTRLRTNQVRYRVVLER